jgi:hypothetical protein
MKRLVAATSDRDIKQGDVPASEMGGKARSGTTVNFGPLQVPRLMAASQMTRAVVPFRIHISLSLLLLVHQPTLHEYTCKRHALIKGQREKGKYRMELTFR